MIFPVSSVISLANRLPREAQSSPRMPHQLAAPRGRNRRSSDGKPGPPLSLRHQGHRRSTRPISLPVNRRITDKSSSRYADAGQFPQDSALLLRRDSCEHLLCLGHCSHSSVDRLILFREAEANEMPWRVVFRKGGHRHGCNAGLSTATSQISRPRRHRPMQQDLRTGSKSKLGEALVAGPEAPRSFGRRHARSGAASARATHLHR